MKARKEKKDDLAQVEEQVELDWSSQKKSLKGRRVIEERVRLKRRGREVWDSRRGEVCSGRSNHYEKNDCRTPENVSQIKDRKSWKMKKKKRKQNGEREKKIHSHEDRLKNNISRVREREREREREMFVC